MQLLHCQALYKTFSSRADLAQQVTILKVAAEKQGVYMCVPAVNVIPHGLPFKPASSVRVGVKVPEPNILAILLQQAFNVEDLQVSITIRQTDCFNALYPGEYILAEHLPRCLLDVSILGWHASNFHWILAQSPRMDYLFLAPGCDLLPDNAPNETNSALRRMTFSTRPENLDASSPKDLPAFLAHCPPLQELELFVDHGNYFERHNTWNSDISANNQGSLSVFIARLEPTAHSLVPLEIQPDPEGWNSPGLWLDFVLPSTGFTKLIALETLAVPYYCLFLPDDGKPPTPAVLFPLSLEHLEMYCHILDLIDWLNHLPYHQDDVPNLNKVTLHCSNSY